MNAAAAEQMNTRSIMIVPISQTDNIEGLLEVFSPERNYFSERHMRELQPLVNVLAEAIKERRETTIFMANPDKLNPHKSQLRQPRQASPPKWRSCRQLRLQPTRSLVVDPG